ncbi:MAG: hypothetical protein WDZ41_02605 [Candidatus Babeliales bacterium]
MKKKLFFSFFTLMFLQSIQLFGKKFEKYDSCFDGAFSSGFVFKNESKFKDVYGHGIINAITADGCYYPWERWGLGVKFSYWRRKGRTSFLQLGSIVQQMPFTLYLRRRKEFDCGLQLYASLGGGIIWTKEKSYLGEVKFNKGIGEAEVGLCYTICHGVGLTSAFRYLFPRQSHNYQRVMVGGYDLRAGISFSI